MKLLLLVSLYFYSIQLTHAGTTSNAPTSSPAPAQTSDTPTNTQNPPAANPVPPQNNSSVPIGTIAVGATSGVVLGGLGIAAHNYLSRKNTSPGEDGGIPAPLVVPDPNGGAGGQGAHENPQAFDQDKLLENEYVEARKALLKSPLSNRHRDSTSLLLGYGEFAPHEEFKKSFNHLVEALNDPNYNSAQRTPLHNTIVNNLNQIIAVEPHPNAPDYQRRITPYRNLQEPLQRYIEAYNKLGHTRALALDFTRGAK